MKNVQQEHVPSSKHVIGRISIAEDGKWWVTWWGEHAEQGGVQFTQGNMGSEDLQLLLSIVAKNMERCEDEYHKVIERKNNEDIQT